MGANFASFAPYFLSPLFETVYQLKTAVYHQFYTVESYQNINLHSYQHYVYNYSYSLITKIFKC